MNNKIAILFTNDGHCALKASPHCFGYAGVAACAKRLREECGAERVCLVDAGDSLGGGAYGLLSAGEVPLSILNACGYDVYVPGNADFTFGMRRLRELEKLAECSFVGANLVDVSGKPFFKPYVIKELGDLKVAFVGALTPYTINVMNPDRYLGGNKDGWQFCQDATGERLYNAVQRAVDDARRDGAQFVVLVSHLGQAGQVERWRSDVVVRHVCGIDLVLDGHSHECYLQQVCDKEGNLVPVMQAGSSLSDIGVVAIDKETMQVDASFVDRAEVEEDEDFARLVEEKTSALDTILSEAIGATSSGLYAKKPGEGVWLVRSSQTNLGDLIADAIRASTGADVALVPSWTIRDNLEAGAISFGDICKVVPLGHKVTSGMLSGRQIADALEYGARRWFAPCGSFLQVSGLSYAIDGSIPSNVLTDDEDGFLSVDGPRRVSDICIAGASLEMQRRYSVAAPDFLLKFGSSGFSMMKASEVAENAVPETEALASYIKSFENGVLPSTYTNLRGEERIKVAGASAGDSAFA